MKVETVFSKLIEHLGTGSLEIVIQTFMDNLDAYEKEIMFQSAVDNFPHLMWDLEEYAVDIFRDHYGTEQGERLFYE